MSNISWGSSVRVSDERIVEQYGEDIAEVCRVDVIHDQARSLMFRRPLGTRVFLIEFSDGSSTEVPEDLLELWDVLATGSSA